MAIAWNDSKTQAARSYVCGYCSNLVGPSSGFAGSEVIGQNALGPITRVHRIYICSFCKLPTYFTHDGLKQTPGPRIGSDLPNLPTDIQSLYGECRAAISNSASTCAVMGLRTLLAHIAVDLGARENQNFTYYVQWLSDQHYVPPGSTIWVDKIRQIGNDAVHRLQIITGEEGNTLLSFTEMILRLVYDYPRRAGVGVPPAQP